MDERSRRAARLMNPFLMVAAALTLPAVAIHESQPGTGLDTVAQVLNWVTWVPFLIEVIVMLTIVPDRYRWIRQHPLELVIVLLTPPLLPPGLQSLRVIRLLRLLRLVKLAQLTRRLFSLEGLRYAALLALLTTVAGGAVFVALEHAHHYSDWTGVYWALTTMTTVGSNVYPTTVGAEILAVAIVLVGISFVALLTGAIAQRFLGPEIAQVEAELQAGEQSPEAIALRQMQEIRDQLQGLQIALERLIADASARQASSR